MSSNKYIINFGKALGYGISADVYLGIRSYDGLRCALKCSRKALFNEVNIMKNLDHKNIIKFYENLQNFEHYATVIVMEHCNQGSLLDFTLLHQGLCDNMFLKVLECLHHGIAYLREKQLMHRDIKPGNMMVHQDRMGYYHVKLGDLGTAKKVDDGVGFQTICGTEPYLHPDIYIEHMENLKQKLTFNANTDLWSIGVTLYHAAITELPFLPSKSLNPAISSEIIKEMYLNKAPGIISGRQNSNDANDITWSDRFPESCQLSPMLQDQASKLIANLMDLSEGNTYERFFGEAEIISQNKRVLIFDGIRGHLQMLYLNTLSYDVVTDQISKSLGYAKEDLIVVTKDKRLAPPAENMDRECFRSLHIKGHLKFTLTDDTALVVVVVSDNNEAVPKEVPTSAESHSMHGPSLGDIQAPQKSYEFLDELKDYPENLMKSMYQICHHANYTDCQIDCYHATATAFTKFVLDHNYELLDKEWQMMANDDLCLNAESLIKLSSDIMKVKNCADDFLVAVTRLGDEVGRLRTRLDKGIQCYKQVGSTKQDSTTMLAIIDRNYYGKDESDVTDDLDFLLHSTEELINEVKVLYTCKDKEQNLFKLDVWRIHLELFDCYKLSKEILDRKVAKVNIVRASFLDWLKPALSYLQEMRTLREELLQYDDSRRSIRSKSLNIYESLRQIIAELDIGNITSFIQPPKDYVDGCSVTQRILEVQEMVEKIKRGQRMSRHW